MVSRFSEDTIIVLAFLGVLGGPLLLTVMGVGIAGYLESEGPSQRRKHKAAKRKLELDRVRREMEMDLTLKELQATGTAEDLLRHRQRLNRKLGKAHGIAPEVTPEDTPEEPRNDAGGEKGDTRWLV